MKFMSIQSGGVFALALALSACGGSEVQVEDSPETADRSGDTLASVLADESGFGIAAEAFERTGLGGVLEGEASYTVFAPSDAAFKAYGVSDAAALEDSDNRAVIAAILRRHMVPGALTLDSIKQAIADKGGPVTMANFGGGDITMAMDGDAVTVSDAGGQSARINGEAVVGSNGVLIPIDAVLVDPKSLASASSGSVSTAQ